MRHSLFIVIAIAITTFSTEAAPKAKNSVVFRVRKGTSLCGLKQCQCEKLRGRMMKIRCDCTDQVKEDIIHDNFVSNSMVVSIQGTEYKTVEK